MKWNGLNINKFIHNNQEIFRVMHNGVNLIKGVHDSFNRPEQVGLGISDTGQTWINIVTGFAIIGNRAAAALTALNGMETQISTGLVNYNISCDFNYASGNSASLEFRTSGIYSNKMFVQMTYSALTMRKNISGSVTTISTYSKTYNSGTYRMRINVNGNVFTVFINEIQAMQVTDDNGTKNNMGVGLYLYSYNNRAITTFDNLLVEPL